MPQNIINAPRSLQLLFVIVILLIAAYTWSINLSQPWIGYYDSDGAFFHQLIDNYRYYGFFDIEGIQLLQFARLPQEEWRVYGHFPPLYSWILYLVTELWGFSEFSFRTINIFFTALTAAMVYHLMRDIFNWRVGLWAMIFFSFSPMIIFWARIPEYEQLASFLILLALTAYLRATRTHNSRMAIIWALLAVAVAAWVGWAVYTFVTVLFIHALLFGQRKDQILSFSMGVLVGVMGLCFLFYLEITAKGVTELYQQFLYRSSSVDGHHDATVRFTALDFAGRGLQVVASGFTPLTLLATLAASVLLVVQPGYWKHRPLGERLLPFVVLAGGLSYALIVRQGTYHHEYLWYYTGVGLTICAAPAVGLLWDRWSKPPARAVLMVFLALFFLASIRVTNEYRAYDIVPLRYELGTEVAKYIEPDQTLATNLPDPLYGFNFYARTSDISYSVKLASFLESPEFRVYLYCREDYDVDELAQDFKIISLEYPECVLLERKAPNS